MSKWNDFIADRKIRVEQYERLPPGSGQYCWYVIEDVDDPCDFNNWSRLADGFADEASAQAWLEEYRHYKRFRVTVHGPIGYFEIEAPTLAAAEDRADCMVTVWGSRVVEWRTRRAPVVTGSLRP